jgi:hypothetical protein
VINPSEGGAKLTNIITEQIEIAMRSHPGPNQVYVIMFGGNNMRKTTKSALEVAKLVSRFRRIMAEAQKAKVKVLLCGDIPDPRPTVDSRLKLLDEALKDLEMGEGNRFIALRSSLLDAQGAVRTDIYKPRGDIHLNALGTQIVSLRIQQMLGIMLPNLVQTPPEPALALAPVQAQAPAQNQAQLAPVQTPPTKPQRTRVQAPAQDPAPVVNAPPVVDVSLVAAVVNVPAVVVQDQVETPMETDEDELLAKLFFKKYGRELPEVEKEKEEDAVDQIKFVIDLTEEKDDEMEVATPVVVVKTEPIETPEIVTNVSVANISNVNNAYSVYNESGIRVSRRLELIELAKARKAINEFGKSLRKTNIIPEKEPDNVIADTDTNMSEDVSVNTVNTIETAEQIIAESDRRAEQIIAASQKEFADEFGDTPIDEFDE